MMMQSFLRQRNVLGVLKCACRLVSNTTTGQNTVHFGFEEINEEEKSEKVYGVFKNVAEKYDLMNDAMSFGIHRMWKDTFVDDITLRPGRTKVLDVAGGTGDIAFRVLDELRKRQLLPSPSALPLPPAKMTGSANTTRPPITVCDINKEMLEIGQQKAIEQNVSEGEIQWVVGDAEGLPFDDNQFDVYTIAFGIRNCTHIDKVLSEAFRVLRPGGKFMCLEFSHVESPALSYVYDLYSLQIIPVIGHIVAGDWKAYQYLVESIRRFPDQEQFANLISQAGFRATAFRNLTCGIVAIHSARKPSNRAEATY